MKSVSLCFLSVLVLSSVGFANPIDTRIDSAHVVALSAKVAEGKLEVRPEDVAKAPYLVRDQLMYVVGYLNGYGGGADIAKAKISLGRVDVIDADRAVQNYTAEFTIAWPRGTQIPSQLQTIVPLMTDGEGKKGFFSKYGAKCQSGEEPADAYTFFYYYRPQKQGCQLSSTYHPDIAIPVKMQTAVSPLQTQNKYPEYNEVWKDGQLTITMIVGTYADGATSAQDIGVQSYNGLYRTLRSYFGNPHYSNVPLGPKDNPGLRYPDIEMAFKYTGNRAVNFNLLLIQKSHLQHPSAAWLKRYHERTKISDLVAYNGHSGLGANIRALSRLGEFAPGRYHLFFVNGCDTFTYIDGALETKIAEINPGSLGSKHLDLITNAMPSPFGGFSRNALALVRSLFEKKATYRQLLSQFDGSQRALVSGEEDNVFPAQF